MKVSTSMRSPCPLNRTLEIVGDKWSLLIIRDLMFFQKQTFGELSQMKEGIATNILSDRLQHLEAVGLISHTGIPKRKKYQLTPMGQDLSPVLQSIATFGMQHFPGSKEYLEEQMRLRTPPNP